MTVTSENITVVSQRIKNKVTILPTNSTYLPRITESAVLKRYSRAMFTAVLFIIAESWGQRSKPATPALWETETG